MKKLLLPISPITLIPLINSPSESHLGGVAHRAEGVDFIKGSLKDPKDFRDFNDLINY